MGPKAQVSLPETPGGQRPGCAINVMFLLCFHFLEITFYVKFNDYVRYLHDVRLKSIRQNIASAAVPSVLFPPSSYEYPFFFFDIFIGV